MARRQLGAILGLLAGAAFLVPSPADLVAAATGPLPAALAGTAVTDQAMMLVAGAVIWVLVGWVALVLLAAAVTRAPGAIGGWGRVVLHRLAPAAARRVAIAAMGTALVGGAAAACAAPSTAAATLPAAAQISAVVTPAGTAPALYPAAAPAPAVDGRWSAGSASAASVDLDWPLTADLAGRAAQVPEPSSNTPGTGASPTTPLPTPGEAAAQDGPPSVDLPGSDGPSGAVPTAGVPTTGVPTEGSPAAGPGAGAASSTGMAPATGDGNDPAAAAPQGSVADNSGTVWPEMPDLSWPGTSAGAAGTAASSGPAGATPAPRGPNGEGLAATVVVQPGDSLWSLARAHLPAAVDDAVIADSVEAWYFANAAVIGGDPDLIQPGQILTPPADHLGDAR